MAVVNDAMATISRESHRNKQAGTRSSYYAERAWATAGHRDHRTEPLDFKQLQYFASIAELGSFTAAAHVLGVAQPALSRQIRALEIELHHTLLRRNGRGVTATDAGKRLLAHCHGILHQLERAREDVGGVHGGLSGKVALGLPPTVANLVAVTIARRFREDFPDAALSIRVELSAVMREWLTSGRVDIALLYNPVPSPELELSPLAHDPLYLVEPRRESALSETIPLRELAELPIIIPSRPHTIRMLLETRLAAVGCRPRVAWEVDGVATILGLVADGAGFAILSRQAIAASARPEQYHGRLIVEPGLVSDLYLATATARAATRTQNATEAIVREAVAEAYAALPGHAG
ncbi:MAG TPA: LysR substrate-binding domain-containing protein [Rhodanobacteraceae bacterium]|nr:LysR substrate-binding domain-containing protein [Rhodanobacteraceae bacterium]